MFRAAALTVCCLVLGLIAVAEEKPSPLDLLLDVLAKTTDPQVQHDVLKGALAGLEGRREVAMPAGWPALAPRLRASRDPEVRELSLSLALVFGDPAALDTLRKRALDTKAATAERQSAVQRLLRKKDPDLVPVLQALLGDRELRGSAIKGLAAYADPGTPGLILERYPTCTESEKADAIQTLASRPAYAQALLDALEKGTVGRRDLDAFTVRQLHGYKDKSLSERLDRVWGIVRSPSLEKARIIAEYKKLLTPAVLKKADLSHGRVVFNKTCATCHVLFGEGGKIGPELTGGQRANLDYVLENMVDPSAVVGRDYQVTILMTKDGRSINGIIVREDERSVTVQTPNERLIVPKNEIEERNRSPLSLMPEGLLDKLSLEEVRDLVAYLASPKQVDLPPKP
jgi:putative heme-binding domain-containing protein